MSWEQILQAITGFFAGLAGWFLFELVKEFKSFKADAGRDIKSLQKEREAFQLTIRNAELTISHKVLDMQKIHHEFKAEVSKQLHLLQSDFERVKLSTTVSAEKAENFEKFLTKALDLSRALNERLKAQEKELKTLKIQMGEVLIVKDRK